MNIPKICPACSSGLRVAELSCPDCGSAVKGSFSLSPLSALSAEDESFVVSFLKNGGSIKAMERELGVSYPTVKSRLRSIVSKLAPAESTAPVSDRKDRQLEILARLKRGEIFTHEAVALLKDLGL